MGYSCCFFDTVDIFTKFVIHFFECMNEFSPDDRLNRLAEDSANGLRQIQ